MARCQLLELCQELRDIIYEHALLDDLLESDGEPIPIATPDQGQSGPSQHGGWQLQTRLLQNRPTWLNLLSTGNHQLHTEVTDFLTRRRRRPNAEPAAAKARVVLRHPSCAVTWTSLPLPPTKLPILDLHVKICNTFATAIRPPSHALAEGIVQVVERYQSHGPRPDRVNPLESPLKLEKLCITLAAPEDQSCCYGNPWMQLRSHYSCLKWALSEIARRREGKGIRGLVIEAGIEERVWERVV